MNKELDNKDRTDRTGSGNHDPSMASLRKLGVTPLSDITPLDIDWLWEGYIPMGMMFSVQGDPGSGKSYAMLALAAALTRGETPPDCKGRTGRIEPRNVLYINCEDPTEYVTVKRAISLGAVREKLFVLSEDAAVFDIQQLERLEKIIVETKPALIIIDPIQGYLGPRVDMHRANDVRPVLAPLAKLSTKEHSTLGFVMHMNKYGGGTAQQRGLGSIDFSANFRVQFLIGPDRHAPEDRLMVQFKNNIGEQAPTQRYQIKADGTFIWKGPSSESGEEDVSRNLQLGNGTAVDEAAKFILEQLQDRPQWSTGLEEKAKKRGINKSALTRGSKLLIDHWKIEKRLAPGYKKWYWSLKGRNINFSNELEYCSDNESKQTALHLP